MFDAIVDTLAGSVRPVLGWLLAAAATGIVLPQWYKVRRGVVDGVSLLTAACAFGACTAWAVTTAQFNDLPAVASSVGPALLWYSIGSTVAAANGRRLEWWGMLATALAVVALAGVLFGFAPVAVAGSLAWILPQCTIAWTARRLAGVSVPTYVCLALENAGWVAYAAATGRVVYGIAPAVQGPLAACIAWQAWRWARTHHATAPVGAPAVVPEAASVAAFAGVPPEQAVER